MCHRSNLSATRYQEVIAINGHHTVATQIDLYHLDSSYAVCAMSQRTNLHSQKDKKVNTIQGVNYVSNKENNWQLDGYRVLKFQT